MFRASYDSLWRGLLYPREQLRAFNAAAPSRANLPYRTWAWLTLIAIIGSLLYGASLSLVLPLWRPTEGALWIALSAGLGWCVFGPALVVWTGRSAFACAHACLITMAYGEAVLLVGAGINAALWLTGGKDIVNPAAFNLAWVALSNVVMAAAMALQLQAIGVPVWKTVLAWMTVLNGSGAAFFRLFQRLLQGGR